MTLKDRIKELCKEKNISMNQLEKELGFGVGYISKLGSTTPNVKKIQLIADFFNVSVDYLMTGKDFNSIEKTVNIDYALTEMPDILKEYVLKLAKLPKEKQEFIMQSIDMLENKE